MLQHGETDTVSLQQCARLVAERAVGSTSGGTSVVTLWRGWDSGTSHVGAVDGLVKQKKRAPIADDPQACLGPGQVRWSWRKWESATGHLQAALVARNDITRGSVRNARPYGAGKRAMQKSHGKGVADAAMKAATIASWYVAVQSTMRSWSWLCLTPGGTQRPRDTCV